MNPNRKITAWILATLCGLLLASCSSRAIRGESPFVQVNGMKLQEQNLTLDLGLRNVNSEAIFIEHIEFSVTLDETSLAVYNAASQASVTANGTENIRFELAATPGGIDLLNELERGDHSNLEYTLEGVLQDNEGHQMKVRRRGHIYPVPGRPGHFR
jgi:LEA14-like dessication related protein